MLRQAWTLMHKISRSFRPGIDSPLLEKHAVLTQVAGANQDVLKIAPSLVVTRQDVDWFAQALMQFWPPHRSSQDRFGRSRYHSPRTRSCDVGEFLFLVFLILSARPNL
jgi:hypothetical protein